MQLVTVVALLAMACAASAQFAPGFGGPGVGGPGFGGPGFGGPGFGGPGVGGPVPPVGPMGPLPVLPPMIPPFGLGFGGLGLGLGLPFGGLGLGLGLGFPFGGLGLGLGLGRFGLLGGFGRGFGRGFGGFRRGRAVEELETHMDNIKKIDQENIKKIEQIRAAEIEPIVVCSVSTQDKMIRCNGLSHTFNCTVRPQISEELRAVELRIQDLDLFRAEGELNVIRLIAPRSKVTAVNPKDKKDIVVAFWNSLVKSQESLVGFEVVEQECWARVNSLVTDLKPEELRVSLTITP